MDFLDPRKKRHYKIRLITGYILMAITIGLATQLLVYGAFGYGINTKTGDIIQNGLLFIDSKPGAANITLTGTTTSNTNTSARLVLPAGHYALKISKAGYRTWQRALQLDEHAIARYVYPFLFPVKPTITSMQNYDVLPPMVTQSPDHHWLMVQNPANTTSKITFDEYDTTKPAQTAVTVSLPDSLLSDASQPQVSLKAVEWASDNNHLLLQREYQGGTEFIIFNRSDPASSINVNKLFNITPSQVALRDKSIDQLYIYDQTEQTLRVAEVSKAVLDPVFLKHVLAFKAYGSNLLTYVTDNNMPVGQVQARIWDNGPTYTLYNFTAGNHYLVDAAQYAGHWYYIAGSDTDDRVNIFKDPLSNINNPAVGRAVPIIALRVLGASDVSFSTNTRFVQIQNGQGFGVYDFETLTRYQYVVKPPLASPLKWMDGHRLIGSADGSVFVMDYDGTNQQSLTPTSMVDGGYFSADYNHMFTLAPVVGTSTTQLQNIDMRAGVDLPKQ